MHKIEVQFSRILAKFAVSLFTGEWIEIATVCYSDPVQSLPLYGGVD